MARFDRIAKFSRGITGRLVLGLSALHGLLLPVFFAGVVYLIKEGHQAQFVNQIRIDSNLFGALLTQDFNEARLQGWLTESVINGQVVFAQIITPQGRILESNTGTHIAPDQFQEDFFFGQHNDTVYHIAIPLYDTQGNVQASLRLGYDETPTLQLIHASYLRSLILAGIYMLFTVALIGILTPHLTRPLRHLRDAAQRIAAGDMHEQLQVDTHIIEVASLADDLEAMRRELINQSEVMAHQAMHDGLTGLPNRNLFHDRLNQALNAARRSGSMLAVCMLDLNRFKEVNDSLGHQMGDLVLQQTALRMRSELRASDTVARLGGDEFIILIPKVEDQMHAAMAASKLIKALVKPLHIDGHTLEIGASIGIALYPQHGESPELLIRHADMAMYHAKKNSYGHSFYRSEGS